MPIGTGHVYACLSVPIYLSSLPLSISPSLQSVTYKRLHYRPRTAGRIPSKSRFVGGADGSARDLEIEHPRWQHFVGGPV